jgi:adenylyl- and sulfurtransferase ThiI
MAQQSWILRFGELGLKSKVVRRSFQRALAEKFGTTF